MEKLFISYCTEFEEGWGQRPDGIVISPDHNKLITHITPFNTRVEGSHTLFWNYTPPQEILCTDEDFEKLTFKDGLLFEMSVNKLPIDLHKKLG